MSLAWLDPSTPLALEGGVFGLALGALVLGIAGRRGHAIGWMVLIGLSGLFVGSMCADAGGTTLDGSFVFDAFSLFAKRLFLGSAVISVLASLALKIFPAAEGSFLAHTPLRLGETPRPPAAGPCRTMSSDLRLSLFDLRSSS